MVLDSNPSNYFAEVEQAAFSPANLVPGTGLSPDRMLMGRVFSYHDTHLHRFGANFEQLPINAPKMEVHSYNKDAAMTYRHAGSQPVYAPNSYGGPEADADRAGAVAWSVESGELGRFPHTRHSEDDDFVQAGTLVREVMDDNDRSHLVTNIVGHAGDRVTDEIQRRVIAYWSRVDTQIGAGVAAGLGQDLYGDALKDATQLIESRANRA
jgi:catalase